MGGDAAKIRASEVRQQKHDRRDAALLLKLLRDGRFPRIWVPSSEQKDLRQLLIHRHKLVRVRAQVTSCNIWRSTRECSESSGCGVRRDKRC